MFSSILYIVRCSFDFLNKSILSFLVSRTGDKDSTTSSTDNNGQQSDSGFGPNDRNGDHGEICCLNFRIHSNSFILEEKYSSQVSRATSKEEMNVDLTPKRQRDFRMFSIHSNK